MKFSVLASGSGGNACYVETTNSKILIDAGLSGKELIRRLELIKVNPGSLNALVLTHEHIDHVKGAGPLARKFDIPVYINRATLRKGVKALGNLSRPVSIYTGQTFSINDILIETFTKCHDAVDPMGIIICSNNVKLGLITDLGRSTRLVEERLKGCHALIIEFNYDQEMLENSSYPLELIRRIKGAEGHLSNRQAGKLLKGISHKNLGIVIPAHLSKENNFPEKVLQEARDVLEKCGLGHTKIAISSQDEPLSMMAISNH